ncbi:hypothetical protein [Rhodopirellula europaea]|uniref:Uncharacterized protein n=1 Tax=Rhodopirellula europaea 6C TaxID=1263867 RepID=M2B2W5_9BACT|nr:hypothetical protein [Rhodopirellula europaea]EMB16539.1 hypothetical protein RE6C_02904 [Rhodopirellula europaea 6C]|tara:strand:- start:14 stop:355 length:342 start_codon:yes stop_codon:yes gene_type:complete
MSKQKFEELCEAVPHRYELQDRYLELTRTLLPAEGRKNRWVVTADHCFMRIILDRLFGDCWYNHLDRRLTAYKQLGNEQLSRCVAMAEQLLAGDTESLEAWNRDSLRWRGKLK